MAQLENTRLAVFRAVARQLSFRKAAEELYLTQPAMSLQIKAPEEDLGLQLSSKNTLSEVGLRPLMQEILLWVVVVAGSLQLIRSGWIHL